MGHYTTTIKNLLASNVSLGLADYPIFDPLYRTALNKKITDHFMYREIGFETPALFVWFLNVKMREIMPLYNQYYQASLLSFNPLYNINLTETSKKETAGSADSTGSSTGSQTNETDTKNRDIHSNTPAGMLSLDDLSDETHTYASDANIATGNALGTGSSESTALSNNTVSNVDDYSKTVQGNNGLQSNSSLLAEFRKTFMNTDMLVIQELEGLFMGLW